MTVETPCIGICEVDQARAICRGCGRTLEEIEAWRDYPAAERHRIMVELPARLAHGENRVPRPREEGTWT